MIQQSIPNLWVALPEIFVLSMACIAILVDVFVKQKTRFVTFLIVQFTLIGAAIISIYLYSNPKTYTFYGMFVHDQVGSLLKIFIYIISFLSFLYARSYIAERKMLVGEYYILGLFSVLGMMVLVSANNLLILFLGLEILSLPLYALAALRRHEENCAEAAMKYYVTGALATGMFLYGLSILYGATNSLMITDIAHIIAAKPFSHLLILYFALVFILAGAVFKLGAAPFHMWVPDVYQGAPAPVTLFIGSAPKIAALGLVFRILVDGMPSLSIEWQQVLVFVALASIVFGNIVAIVQTNIKRMLAYSSIAHMGYMSLGLIAATPDGYSSAMFYMFIYAIMATGAFAIVTLMSKSGIEAEHINDYRGLNTRNPWLAFMMLLLMFSMAGIPPTAGFFAKLGVLNALVHAHLVWLAAVALIFAVIGSYYYLAIVKVMYFEEPAHKTPIATSPEMTAAISINCIVVLLLGLFPTVLINLCYVAFGGV
jgi:NADH-quinone oxidoreductase subunit N